MTQVFGEVHTGYEPVSDAFQRNFTDHGEVGAAFTLHHRGRKVVDIWAGIADVSSAQPWTDDTTVLVFSTTKGATAVCAHLLVEQGAVDLDAPVATYWPEFGAAGKDTIPVRWLLSHRAGLPVIDNWLTPEEVLAWTPLVDALAAQRPAWEPGTAHGYHGFTYGHLVGEVVRRISGRTIGTFFADEVAKPLALDFWIGVPESEDHRVATLVQPSMDPSALDLSALTDEQRSMLEVVVDPDSFMNRALKVCKPELDWASRTVRAAEVPAASGVTNARSLSRLYASLIGEVDGVRLLRPETVEDATIEQSNGPDRVLMMTSRFGLGFWLPCEVLPMAGPTSFGHGGAGGSLGFADPEADYAFGYVMNRMDAGLTGDPRSQSLIDACNRAVA